MSGKSSAQKNILPKKVVKNGDESHGNKQGYNMHVIPSREQVHITPWEKENHLEKYLSEQIC